MPRDDSFYIDPKKIECNQWRYTIDSSRLQRFRFDYGNRVIQVQWRNGWPNPHKVKWPREAPPGRPIVAPPAKRKKALARKGYIYALSEDDDPKGKIIYEYYRELIHASSRGHRINEIDQELIYRPMKGKEWQDSQSTRKGTGPAHRYGHHDTKEAEEGP